MAKNKGLTPATPHYYPDCDAHTLAEAKAITNDPKRYSAAVKAAGGMATEQMAKARAMKSIGNRKVK